MKIALGGTAANPPHYGHKMLVDAIVNLRQFDLVQWIVSGNRPDKPALPPSIHRWHMTRMLIADPLICVTYDAGQAVPTIAVIHRVQEQYPHSEIVWFCGSDHFVAREAFDGKNDMETFWHDGTWLMDLQHFLIVRRRGINDDLLRLPRNCTVITADIPAFSSTEIRERLTDHRDCSLYTSPDVLAYSAKHKLYC